MKKNKFNCYSVLDLYEVTDNIEEININLDEKQCAAIAEILEVKKIKDFLAEVKIVKQYGIFSMKGKVSAELLLTDVVSLEEFWFNINLEFDEEFKLGKNKNEDNFDIDGIYFCESNELDVFDVVLEYVALEIPANPRKNKELFVYKEFEENTEEKNNPFAGLDKLLN